MDEAWQRRVRERAYTLWEREGRLEGRAEEHWFRAEAELRAEEAGPSAGTADRSGERRRWTEEMVDVSTAAEFGSVRRRNVGAAGGANFPR
jgi:hypothetical protein